MAGWPADWLSAPAGCAAQTASQAAIRQTFLRHFSTACRKIGTNHHSYKPGAINKYPVPGPEGWLVGCLLGCLVGWRRGVLTATWPRVGGVGAARELAQTHIETTPHLSSWSCDLSAATGLYNFYATSLPRWLRAHATCCATRNRLFCAHTRARKQPC